jgi:GNAT superfamily N-acetyltransferase
MIRIRSITSPALPIARDRVAQVEEIFSENFPKLAGYADKIPELLANPFKHDYQTILIVSETTLGKVTGFALLLHFPDIHCSFLDFIAVRRKQWGGGLGSALYEAVREYCEGLSSWGLYIEVRTDAPATFPSRPAFTAWIPVRHCTAMLISPPVPPSMWP